MLEYGSVTMSVVKPAGRNGISKANSVVPGPPAALIRNGQACKACPALNTTKYACPCRISAITVGRCSPTASEATVCTNPQAQLLATTAQSCKFA